MELPISEQEEQLVLKQETEDKPFPCLTCGENFLKKEHLMDRMRTHTDRLQDDLGKEEDFSDQQLCGQESNSSLDQKEPEALQIKEEQQKPEDPWTKEETMELNISEQEEQLVLKHDIEEKPSPCLTRGENFLKKEQSMADMGNQAGQKIYECLSCGKMFTQKSRLNQHIRIHTGSASITGEALTHSRKQLRLRFTFQVSSTLWEV
ncbi:zinc finger protein OZF-like [Cyprinodon tularosa]|uniref:zinc finger protein OZF-like n=1 Tax=Cyprinodon tularosa TaxID=77115 RepID=UPI0018E23AD0|nr:zinc finger protein OZF-like [Cyprinodon tularosa]